MFGSNLPEPEKESPNPLPEMNGSRGTKTIAPLLARNYPIFEYLRWYMQIYTHVHAYLLVMQGENTRIRTRAYIR